MTHEPDIPERDPALDAAWREHSTEMPSAALDVGILAAAHRAVKSTPRDAGRAAAEATSPQRWWMPLAAAATIGAVALGILQTMPQQDSVTTPAVSDELQVERRKQVPAAVTEPVAPPAPAAALAKPAAKVTVAAAKDNVAPPRTQMAAAPTPQPFPAEKKAESAEFDFKDRERMAPKLASAPEPAPAPPATAAPMSESARADVRQRNEAQPSAPSATGTVALGKTAARMDAAAAPAVDADAWIARIRKLHDEGRLADAAKELVAMRIAVADADARLPRELRAWAATVKP